MAHQVPTYGPIGGEPEEWVRVDGKAWFTAERTFMAWMHLAITVGSIGLGLVGVKGDDMRSISGLLMLPTAFFVIWGAVQFYRRSIALSHASTASLEDRVGPTIALIVMVSVLVINTANAWRRFLAVPDDELDDA